MQKVSLSNKVFTENPLLDEIVYNARQIIFGGVVLKDYDKANNSETLESITNGDVLVAIGSGAVHFFNFDYDYDFLIENGYSIPDAIKYSMDNKLIPVGDRDRLMSKASARFIENYEEYNNYYRMLNGKPNYDETGIYEGLWIDTRYIIYTQPTSMDYIYPTRPIVPEEEEKYYSLIHELDLSNKNTIYENGTCENIINSSSILMGWGLTKDDVMYVMHIGDREVEYYNARVAEKFALLYCPSCDSTEVKARFKELFEANRLYMLYTMYSDAYKYRSDYYDNFIMVFLTIQTIIDMIVELPEYIIRRDVFDARTCKYIFESNGVKYFKDIPLKYQISLVKNLNKLIKFKSTDKCIVDIISIFGTENIQVFRYYILKDRNATEPVKDLHYYNYKKEQTTTFGTTELVEDNDTNYDLKFIKVPMLDCYDNYIRNDTNLYSYNTLTETDDYWIGDREYDVVKSDIKNLDFTVLRSKYYSVEAVIDLAKRNFTLTYFMNIIMYNKLDYNHEKMLVNLPNISTTKKFNLVNTIITLFSLSYIYYGVEDTILDSRAKNAQILGFNMEVDLAKIDAYLEEHHKGLTRKELHVDTFLRPDENEEGIRQPISFNQLQEIYFTNKKCYDHVIELLCNPPSKDIYDAYKYIFDSMMTTNRNMECFLTRDNTTVEEYKALGYITKFVNVPKIEDYEKEENYLRDYKLIFDSTDYETLILDVSPSFDDTHEFYLYIKEEGKTTLTQLMTEGEHPVPKTARMAYTYREYLSSADNTLYGFIVNILGITDFETRQEACINAIQSIISYLKDYINQYGEEAIPLENVFSSLPSISMDFIKKYVTEVIDFFKSFKIFTHGSSILYLIQGKFGNYVQLIEKILLRYKLDKSEIVRMEDAIDNTTIILTPEERHKIIDKVWLDITTLLQKSYSEYYNYDNYEQVDKRIHDYCERFSQYQLDDSIFTEKYIKEIQDYAVDAILGFIVSMRKDDKVNIDEKIKYNESRIFKEHYNEWMIDLVLRYNAISKDDRYLITDNCERYCTHDLISMAKIIDGRKSMKANASLSDYYSIDDNLYLIYTHSI